MAKVQDMRVEKSGEVDSVCMFGGSVFDASSPFCVECGVKRVEGAECEWEYSKKIKEEEMKD